MNQDYMYTSELPVGNLPNLYILADGMGGHNAGDYASRYTVEMMVRSVRASQESSPVSILRSAISEANLAVVQQAGMHIDLEGMGTTVVAATCIAGELCVANVGDSRVSSIILKISLSSNMSVNPSEHIKIRSFSLSSTSKKSISISVPPPTARVIMFLSGCTLATSGLSSPLIQGEGGK